ncbi:hypothetical protein DL96DRAFT_1810619 [Flagelloscypha sp. PMI_526]|nr:hypothetical protein DL96DRAFT_1810619 [Flagelloscypha sp. PMI_526]
MATGVGYLLAKSLLTYLYQPESLINIADIVYGVSSSGFLFWLSLYEHRPHLVPQYLYRFLFKDSIWKYLGMSSSNSIELVTVQEDSYRDVDNRMAPLSCDSNTEQISNSTLLSPNPEVSSLSLGTGRDSQTNIDLSQPDDSTELVPNPHIDVPNPLANSNLHPNPAQPSYPTLLSNSPSEISSPASHLESVSPSIPTSFVPYTFTGYSSSWMGYPYSWAGYPYSTVHFDGNHSTDLVRAEENNPDSPPGSLNDPYSNVDEGNHYNHQDPTYGLAESSSAHDLSSEPYSSPGYSQPLRFPPRDSLRNGANNELMCAKCYTTNSPEWETESAAGSTLCNACRIRHRTRGMHQPTIQKPVTEDSSLETYQGPRCAHCGVTKTPAWVWKYCLLADMFSHLSLEKKPRRGSTLISESLPSSVSQESSFSARSSVPSTLDSWGRLSGQENWTEPQNSEHLLDLQTQHPYGLAVDFSVHDSPIKSWSTSSTDQYPSSVAMFGGRSVNASFSNADHGEEPHDTLGRRSLRQRRTKKSGDNGHLLPRLRGTGREISHEDPSNQTS